MVENHLRNAVKRLTVHPDEIGDAQQLRINCDKGLVHVLKAIEALTTAQAQAAAQEQRIAVLEAETKTLRGHIAHMANWITRANKGVKQGPYSFEAIGEDFAALGEQQ